MVTNAGNTDEFGLAARVIGRPFKFFGDQSVDSDIQTQLSTNNALKAICIPGKEVNPATTTIEDYNKLTPTTDTADKLNDVGPLSDLTTGVNGDGYYASCSAIYNDKLIRKSNEPSSADTNTTYTNSSDTRRAQASQNINSLMLELIDPNNLALWKLDESSGYYSGKGLDAGICLRAPGASCHTDFECAPSKFVGARIKSLDITDVNSGTQQTTESELEFWQEDLICSQKYSKYHDFYEPEENRCCREIGKVINIETNRSIVKTTGLTVTTPSGKMNISDGSTSFDFIWNNDDCGASFTATADCKFNGYAYNDATGNVMAAFPQTYKRGIAGIHMDDNDDMRYSRTNMVYDKLTETTSSYPALDTALPRTDTTTHTSVRIDYMQQLGVGEDYAYETFHSIAARTCCSGNWVRNFHEDNGGGHIWNSGKKQNEVPMENFECINWIGDGTTSTLNTSCDIADYDTTNCRARNLNAAERKSYLNFFGRLELLGIPQIKVPSSIGYHDGSNPGCMVNPDITNGQTTGYTAPIDWRQPVPGTTASSTSQANQWTETFNDAEYSIYRALEVDDFYLAADDPTNFDQDMKQVFSDKEATCCLPAGEYHGDTLQGNQCCTGFVNSANPGYCCLQDYTDISVYLNRYVSSEAANLSSSEFDRETGYIKDPRLVQQIAALKNLCCSGNVAFGRAIQDFKIRMTSTGDTYSVNDNCTQRFVTGAEGDNNDAVGNAVDGYKAGLHWNDHLYCAPAGVTDDTPYAGNCDSN